MNPFDVDASPLTGVNLIEASAGTGKTWSLARLVVRLVVEQRREVGRILVVTFTEAATEELRVRVRQALTEAYEAAGDLQAALALREAVAGFDQAAIHTIHGFCRRVLADSAFESGALFDGQLISDQAALVQEAVDDFWRARAESFSALYLGYLRSQDVSPESLAALVMRCGARPYARILPEGSGPRLGEAEQAFARAFAALREAWNDDAERFLLSSPALNRSKYRLASMPGLVADVRRFLASGPTLDLPDSGFGASKAREALKKNYEDVELPEALERAQEMLDSAEALREGYAAQTAALRAEALRAARQRLQQRKGELGVSYFDDLLLDVHRALRGPASQSLIDSVRSRYDVALVDEFQDTDSVQFEIFSRIFDDLFLIGDPKQAIYRFRGADIHAYLRARRGIDSSFTLDNNHRSREPIVRAVNVLFSSRPRPFLVEEIAYSPARAARQDSDCPIADLPAVSVWFIRRADGKRPSKEKAHELVCRSLAGDIMRLLDSGRAGADQVAVLVRSNSQAAAVQAALRAHGIPAVRNAPENAFASQDAAALQRVLAAVAEPGRLTALRSAVATDLIGLSGERIYELSEDEWQGWADRFGEYGEVWARRGFYPMFRLLMDREQVTVRLLAGVDGELRLCRLTELADKMHEAEAELRLGPEGLAKWLSDRRLNPPDDPREAARMESDAEAVRIVTIHLAKGGEWPVVYCPFAWDLPQPRNETDVVCHEADEVILDLGTPQIGSRRRAEAAETLAEELRLLYVALTRARDRLVFTWGAVRSAEQSALGYLLHPGSLEAVSDAQLLDELGALARKGAISVEEMPAAATGILRRPDRRQGELAARSFSGAIDAEFRITSFTAWTRAGGRTETGSALGDEAADRDDEPGLAALAAPVAAAPASPLIGFPRGTRAGTFVHAVLEQMDFARVQDSRDKVRQALRDFGYEEGWLEPLLDLGARIAKLPVGKGMLRDCGATAREVPFTFPLRRVRPRSVSALLGAGEDRLSADPVRGYLRGYMDLVVELDGRFWLVDWKSNYLGPDSSDYGPEALARVMTAELYTVQARLYALALHRYLGLRLADYDYERCFGGVIYAFLRGLDGEGAGVHAQRPSRALMDRLAKELVDA